MKVAVSCSNWFGWGCRISATKIANFSLKFSLGTLVNHSQYHCSYRMVELEFGR